MVEIVAEFTTNHFGHIGLLCRMVDRAAAAGASAIKMQRKDVGAFYSQEKLHQTFASPFGNTYLDYRSVFELQYVDWERFDLACDMHEIPWFATVQDVGSLYDVMAERQEGVTRQKRLERAQLNRLKLASSNARNGELLAEVAREVPQDWEIVVSVGGSTLEEIDRVVTTFSEYRKLWLLHCVAEYPCPPNRLRLGNITELHKRFACDRVHVGYSGHELGFAPTLAAVNLGAEMIERHFCVSRHSFVHHIECSLEPGEFAEMVRLANASEEEREAACRELPSAAYASRFGMSELEERFLVQQAYGQHYLGGKSVIS